MRAYNVDEIDPWRFEKYVRESLLGHVKVDE